ncbi:MAG: hypothetical protein ACTSV5_05105 [Promethearchaeota archaeon]
MVFEDNEKIIKDIKNKIQEKEFYLGNLCEIFLLTDDEVLGRIILSIYPDDSIREDNEKIRIINIHPIWYIEVNEINSSNPLTIECGERICYGYKMFIPSFRKVKKEKEEIIIIISLPLELEILGYNLLKKITNCIKDSYINKLYMIIESEIAKFEVVKTQDIIELIRQGNQLKKTMLNEFKEICSEYFYFAIRMLDNSKINSQKALSFLILKGINLSNSTLKRNNNNTEFFKLSKIRPSEEEIEEHFSILTIKISHNYKEFEILIQNTSKNKLNDVNIRIIFIINFSEEEIFNQNLEYWLSEEILVFTIPIEPLINDFYIFITDNNKRKIFSRKISILKKPQNMPAIDC